jgi:hypothetical protein
MRAPRMRTQMETAARQSYLQRLVSHQVCDGNARRSVGGIFDRLQQFPDPPQNRHLPYRQLLRNHANIDARAPSTARGRSLAQDGSVSLPSAQGMAT